jgi:hypothetical protein
MDSSGRRAASILLSRPGSAHRHRSIPGDRRDRLHYDEHLVRVMVRRRPPSQDATSVYDWVKFYPNATSVPPEGNSTSGGTSTGGHHYVCTVVGYGRHQGANSAGVEGKLCG